MVQLTHSPISSELAPVSVREGMYPLQRLTGSRPGLQKVQTSAKRQLAQRSCKSVFALVRLAPAFTTCIEEPIRNSGAKAQTFASHAEDPTWNEHLMDSSMVSWCRELLSGAGFRQLGWGTSSRRSFLETLQLLAQSLAVDAEDPRRLSLVAADLSQDVANVIPLDLGEGAIKAAIAGN